MFGLAILAVLAVPVMMIVLAIIVFSNNGDLKTYKASLTTLQTHLDTLQRRIDSLEQEISALKSAPPTVANPITTLPSDSIQPEVSPEPSPEIDSGVITPNLGANIPVQTVTASLPVALDTPDIAIDNDNTASALIAPITRAPDTALADALETGISEISTDTTPIWLDECTESTGITIDAPDNLADDLAEELALTLGNAAPQTPHQADEQALNQAATATEQSQSASAMGSPEPRNRAIFAKKGIKPAPAGARQHAPDNPSTPIQAIINWFTTGNPLLKVGIVVLFLGLAFLLRLVSEHIETPLWLRYLAVALSGVGATGAGLYLATKRREYGLTLQGFGLAVVYLTTLAALKLAALISAPVAFALMTAAVVVKIALALRQDAKILAQIALIGGLSAPILTSDGSGNYVLLFTYLAILNTGVAVIAQQRAWRSLNAISLLGTFALAFAWQAGADMGQLADARTASLLFGGYHVALYGLIVCLYAKSQLRAQSPLPALANDATLGDIVRHYLRFGSQVGVVDAGVLFGSALMGFVFLYWAVADAMLSRASMWLAFAFAVGYAIFAVWTQRDKHDVPALSPLADAFWLLVMGIVALGIGLGLDDRLASGLWALQAGLVYLYGVKDRLPQVRAFALAVFLFASSKHLTTYHFYEQDDWFITGDFYSALWLAASGLAMYGISYRINQRNRKKDKPTPLADWERYARYALLSLTLIHSFALPALVLSPTLSIWTTVLMLVVYAAWQYRFDNKVGLTLAPVAALWLVTQTTYLHDDFLHARTYSTFSISTELVAGLVLLGLAFVLEHAPWRYHSQFNQPAVSHTNPKHIKFRHSPAKQGGWRASYSLLFSLVVLYLALSPTFHSLNNMIDKWADPQSEIGIMWALILMWTVCLGAVSLAKKLTHHHWHVLALSSLTFAPCMAFLLITLSVFDGVDLALVAVAVASLGLSLIILAYQRLDEPALNGWHGINLALITITASALCFLSPVSWLVHLWILPTLVIWLICSMSHLPWVLRFTGAYHHFATWAFIILSALWVTYVAFKEPMLLGTRLPLVNAVDMLQLALAYLLVRTLRPSAAPVLAQRDLALVITGALALFSLSALVVRTWYFYAGTPWQLSDLLADFGLQASLSLTWAGAGIGLMVWGARSVQRTLWLVGASLMGVVVVKLFLVELGDSGGVSRIVSFIGVGLLLLLVGWFAPAPPRHGKSDEN